MASLKKLQYLQDREHLECGLPSTHNILRPSSTSNKRSHRLIRNNVEIMGNPFCLSFKNLNGGSLSMQSEDEILSDTDEIIEPSEIISPELTSPELLAIYEEKDQLVTAIIGDIQTLRNYFLSQMSQRTKNLAFQVWMSDFFLGQCQNIKAWYFLQGKPSPILMFDYPSLYGRCFNLSLNIKILSQSQYSNPLAGSRVLSDLDILESSLCQISSSGLSNLLENVAIR